MKWLLCPAKNLSRVWMSFSCLGSLREKSFFVEQKFFFSDFFWETRLGNPDRPETSLSVFALFGGQKVDCGTKTKWIFSLPSFFSTLFFSFSQSSRITFLRHFLLSEPREKEKKEASWGQAKKKEGANERKWRVWNSLFLHEYKSRGGKEERRIIFSFSAPKPLLNASLMSGEEKKRILSQKFCFFQPQNFKSHSKSTYRALHETEKAQSKSTLHSFFHFSSPVSKVFPKSFSDRRTPYNLWIKNQSPSWATS